MGNQPEMIQGTQISSTQNETGDPYIMPSVVETTGVVKWKEFASKIKFTLPNQWKQALKEEHEMRRNVRNVFKIYCQLLLQQISFFQKQQSPLSARHWWSSKELNGEPSHP